MNIEEITAYDVVEGKKGDSLAKNINQRWSLSWNCLALCRPLILELIIIGGVVCRRDLLIEPIRQTIKDRLTRQL
jgi:hypothetical protein